MLALPPDRMAAAFALGGSPTGAPGSGVVVVVPSSCPAAGAAATSEVPSSRPASASVARRRGVRDGDLIPPPIPPLGGNSAAPRGDLSEVPPIYERALTKFRSGSLRPVELES